MLVHTSHECYMALCVLILKPDYEDLYHIRRGFGFDSPIVRKLLFFGFPTGLMYLTESGGFTVMVLSTRAGAGILLIYSSVGLFSPRATRSAT